MRIIQQQIAFIQQAFPKALASLREMEEEHIAVGPVWKAEEINALEKEQQLSLPEGYKAFLLEIGDGGAGFSYDGITSLRKHLLQSKERVLSLAKPFPLTKAWLGDPEERDLYTEDFFMSEDILDEYLYDLPPGIKKTDGTLTIGITEDHCTLELIMNGPHADEVWVNATGYDAGGFFPSGKTFLELYIDWLNSIKDDEVTYIDSGVFTAPW